MSDREMILEAARNLRSSASVLEEASSPEEVADAIELAESAAAAVRKFAS